MQIITPSPLKPKTQGNRRKGGHPFITLAHHLSIPISFKRTSQTNKKASVPKERVPLLLPTPQPFFFLFAKTDQTRNTSKINITTLPRHKPPPRLVIRILQVAHPPPRIKQRARPLALPQ